MTFWEVERRERGPGAYKEESPSAGREGENNTYIQYTYMTRLSVITIYTTKYSRGLWKVCEALVAIFFYYTSFLTCALVIVAHECEHRQKPT